MISSIGRSLISSRVREVVFQLKVIVVVVIVVVTYGNSILQNSSSSNIEL